MEAQWRVPFNRAHLAGAEAKYVLAAINSRALSGPGPHSQACEALIRLATGAPMAALVPSCTAALELAALLFDLGPGDEVVVPSYTFVTTASAVALRGATPVFADIDPVTLNLDPASAEAAITARTRYICPIHYAGVPADMEAFGRIAARHGIGLVEDAAQAFGASRGGRPAGSFGAAAAFSFHGTKNVTAGEAGALVVNDPSMIDRARILRDKGTDRARFLAGLVDAYRWQDLGSSQVVNELTAAFLQAQLERAEQTNAERVALWRRYRDALAPAAAGGHFAIPAPPVDAAHNGHIFFLMLPDAGRRIALGRHLERRGVQAVTHYTPLHSSPAGRRFGRSAGALPYTDQAAAGLLRLPLWNGLGALQDQVIEAVLDWCARAAVAA